MAKEIKKEYYNTKTDKQDLESRWWTLEDKDVADHLFPLVMQTEQRQYYRKTANLRHARLYSNLEIMGLQAGLFSRTANDAFVNNRVTLNVIKSCIDTAASKIAKAKPRPLFLTSDGDFTLQQKAKKLTKYLDGAFDAMDIYTHSQRGFVDAAVFGTGATKFFIEDGEVKCERSLIDELLVEDADGIYATPQCMYQIKYVNKFQLVSIFPDLEQEIMTAQSGISGDLQSQAAIDLVKVIEAWHLPSGPKAKDGRHAICIRNQTLLSEPYKKSYFPFVFQRWNHKITGFYGMGIAEELIGIQLEINKLLSIIQRSMHVMAVPRIWVENNSMVNVGGINNEPGMVGKYTGNPPVAVTWPSVHPEVYAHIQDLYKKAFEIVGISMLSATSQKPAGLNSGIALREYQDVESDRFQLVGQRYEEAFMDAGKMVIDLTRDLAKSGKDPFVKVKDGKKMEIIHWDEVDLKSDQYEMRVFPTSILPTTPSGKLQTVQELVQAGFIPQEMALSLLDFPDLDAFISMQKAALDDANQMIDAMLSKGEYQSPEPFMDLKLTLKLTQSAYLRARVNSVPENRLELLRRFMDECSELVDQAALASQQQQAMPPQAVPEKPPVSALLPNGPQGAMNGSVPAAAGGAGPSGPVA